MQKGQTNMDHEKMTATIDEIVARHSDRKPIVAILQDIQEEYRYLPKEALVPDNKDRTGKINRLK